MYQDNTGLYIERDKFIPIQGYYEYTNQKKEQIKRMMMYGPYTLQVIKKMPDIIKHWKDLDNGFIKIPIGLAGGGWSDRIQDKTKYSQVKQPKFLGQLYEDQQQKVDELLQKRVGIMNASTGVGKGVMIPNIISQIPYKSLVIVPGIQLLNEMVDRIDSLLGCVPLTFGGKKQGKKVIVNENIIVSTLDSMFNIPEDILGTIGCILIDECDKSLSSDNRLEFMTKLSPKYLYGFTGTMKINNVHDKIFNMFFGRTTEFIQKNFIPNIFRIRTEFQYSGGYTIEEMKEFAELNNELMEDDNRNNLIVSTIATYLPKTEMKKGIVLSNRVEHCDVLSKKLENLGICTRIITGEIKKEEREQIIKEVTEAINPIVLIGSASILGRGFDLKQLQSIFLTYPSKFDSSVIQACGRVQRQAPNKTYSQIFDFIDESCGVLNNQAISRLRTMKREYGPVKVTYIY